MMRLLILPTILVLLCGLASSEKHPRSSVEMKDFIRCHHGHRDTPRRCNEYVNIGRSGAKSEAEAEAEAEAEYNVRYKRQPPPPPPDVDKDEFTPLDAQCMQNTWDKANKDNNWGSCMEMKVDATHRYITSNTVPDYYYNPYCPIGLGYGYCIQLEIDLNRCFFPETILKCGGEDNDDLAAGMTPYGDVWVALEAYYKIPLQGNPTLADRPSDMYDVVKVGAGKSLGPVLAVASNGIGILGPNDAGDISIDEAGFQMTCGGHVTPPLSKVDPSVFPDGAPPATPPVYHFHKAPDCLEAFTSDYKGISRGGTPNKHGKLVGWALDGFGIYTYQDIGGKDPVVDECGGHFGPVSDDSDEVVYHYHTRTYVPYVMACQGPALGKCDETQGPNSNYCHYGCGAEVCVQPGTKPDKLKEYLATWDEEWLDTYTINNYNYTINNNSSARTCSLVLAYLAVVGHVVRALVA